MSSPGNMPPIPDARFGFLQMKLQKYIFVTPNDTVYFDASKSFDPDGKVVEYYWQIGIGEGKRKVEHKFKIKRGMRNSDFTFNSIDFSSTHL